MERSLAILGIAVAALLLCTPPSRATDFNQEITLYGDRYRSGDPRVQGWARWVPALTTRVAPSLTFQLRAVVEADTARSIEHRGYDDDDRALAGSILRFEELKLRWDAGPVDVEIGKQRLTWARTDGVNATDNLTPRDWTDPLDERRLSPWSARVGFERGAWSAEAAVVPRYAPSRLPALGKRWLLPEIESIANPAYPQIGPRRLDLDFSWAGALYPATTLNDWQWGVRGGYRGSRFEWRLSWYEGFDDAARIGARISAPKPGSGELGIALVRRFPRLQVTGADGVLIAGPVVFRAEAGYFHYPDGLDDGSFLYEVEADWTRGDWGAVLGYGDDQGAKTGADLQGALDAALASALPTSGVAATATSSLDQARLPAAFLRLGRNAPTEWRIGLEAVVGTSRGDHWVRLDGSIPLTDTFRLGGEIDLIAGPPDTFWGRWRGNDRVRVFLRIAL